MAGDEDKGKRKRKGDAEAAPALGASQQGDAAVTGKKRRRKGPKADESQLNQDELARRQRQRELRAMAIRLREQGKIYNPKRHRKHKPRRRVAVIIIPIFWNKKAGDKAAVLNAAEAVQELLRGAGIKADTDTTTELTPGQKMRSWEEKGVMVRVEMGAKEVDAGTAVVARCTTPGQVADKQTVAVGPQLLQLVLEHLEELGIPLQTPPATGAAAGQKAAAGSKDTATDAEGDGEGEDVRQQQVQQQRQQQEEEQAGKGKETSKRKAQPSGDDLDGDFAALPLLPNNQPAAAGKKGKKQRDQAAAAAAAAEVAASVFGEGRAGQEEERQEQEGKGKKGKKHKVVKF